MRRLGALAASLLLLLPASPAHAGGNRAPEPPTALTVGDRTEPLAVEGTPLFGWQPRDPDRDEIQTAYQIRVRTPAGRTVWDSGRVGSRETAYQPYAGPPLAPGTAYLWGVRSWDRAGTASPWATSAFSTGIGDGDWEAAWIRRTTAEPDDYTLARRELAVTRSRVTRAVLYVSASHQYQAFVNGAEVDRGQAFAYPGEGYYQATDVTSALEKSRGGRAALGILYHWYGPGQGRPAGEPGLLARLVVEHADGTRQVVGTDATWKVTRGPWLDASYRNGDGRDYLENVDGRIVEQQRGWASPGFDDTSWQRATEVSTPAPHLTAQQTRLAYETRLPVSVSTLASGAIVADFGRVVTAMPRVRFRHGTSGTRVSLVAGYVLNADGSVSNTPQDNQSTDLSYSYVQSTGDQTFTAFTYEGFRYLQLDHPGDIAAVLQHTDADPARAATFSSSDDTLDEVFTLMQRSALYSSQEQFLDTPTREKGQFLADSVNISQALVAGSGDRAMTAKAIREFVASQARYWPDGRLNAVYPNGDGKRDIPDFTELFPGWVWSYYTASGDRSLLADAYPASLAIADYVRTYRDPATGLVTNLAGGSGAYQYGIIDWPVRYGYDTGTAARTTVNILAVHALRSTARQAEALGKDGRALRADADALVEAINTHLRRPDGVYHDGLHADGSPSEHTSQIANAYAIAFGVSGSREWSPALPSDLQMGPMTANFLLAALHEAGRDDLVLQRLTDPSGLGWANVLARGGTFTWESWDAPETGQSMSHGWGAAALLELQRSLLGVTVTSPAARTVTVAPPAPSAGLTRASGTVWTQAGRLGVSWSSRAIIVDVPVNVTAKVRIPATGRTITVGSGHNVVPVA